MATQALTRAQSRDVDRIAIEELGISGLVLMENAGRGCVDVLENLGIGGPVVIFCGKGNNAGDGFVIARHLELRGHECRVLLFTKPGELRGDAASNFAILQKTGVAMDDLATPPADALPPPDIAKAAWLVDAVLGTGAHGNPRAPFDTAIRWMNSRGPHSRVLAVDLPSGLDCDTGAPGEPTVRADHTCTFFSSKIGFLEPRAQAYTGEVHVCDIGAPRILVERILARGD